MKTVYIQNTSFLFDDIRAGSFSFEDEYLQETMLFCQHWLNGQETFVFNTSGSTGCPSAIHASRAQMQASVAGTIQALGLTEQEHIYLCISTRMIGGAMMLVRAMELGCDLTITHPSANPVEALPPVHPYSFVSFVPMQVYDLASNAGMQARLNQFKHILLGGAPATPAMLEALSLLTPAVWQTYGMTETLSHIALRRVGRDLYYTALDGVQLKTDDRNCLCILAEVTNNEWLLTNDVVNMVNDRQFELLGRMDDVINSGGIKIFTYDVELAISEKMNDLEIPHKPLFVSRQHDERFGEIVVAVMLGDPLAQETIDELIRHCTSRLGKYSAPKHIFFVKEFVKLESGKINKPATLEKALGEAKNVDN